MSTTAVTAAAASFRKEQSTCTHVRMCVGVRGRGEIQCGHSWGQERSLIRNTFYRQQENYFYCVHLQVLRQGIFFCGDVFKANYLQHGGLEPADLNLAKLLFTSRGALHGAPGGGQGGMGDGHILAVKGCKKPC